MAVTKVKAKTIDAWKKKRWYKLVAPRLFNEQIIGETPASEPDMLNNRTVSVSLMNLTRDFKKQQITVLFGVDKVQGEMAYCSVKRIFLNPSSIRRLVRKEKDYIDDSFVIETTDKKRVRIKPLIITMKSSVNSVSTAIRRKTRAFIRQKTAQLSYDDLLGNVVYSKLQKELRGVLNKIYPVQICEIRSIGIDFGPAKPGEISEELVVQQPQAKEEANASEGEEAPAQEMPAAKKQKKAAEKGEREKPAMAEESEQEEMIS